MKKTKLMLIIFTMTTLLFSGALKADSGIKAGLDLTKFNLSKKGLYSGYANEKTSNLKRLRFGVYHNFEITESVGIQTELFYVQKGSQIKGLDGNKSMTANTKLSYIELPVLLKLTVPTSSVKFHLLGGGYAAFRLSGKMYTTTKVNGKKVGSQVETNVKDKFKKLDFGITVGAGVSVDLNAASLVLEARYNHGLANVYDVKNSKVKVKNRAFSFMVGFGF